MMATTHALVGVVLAAITLWIAPDAGPAVVFAGALGGLFPDFDLYAGHRKTLHFPMYYSIAALVAVGIGALVTNPVTVAVALFLVAAAVHSVMDIFGGGLELKPWEGTSDRAVYDHFRSRWIAPRRWIRYDGAPEDFLLGAVLGIPSLWMFDGTVHTLVLAALVVSGVYALLRKPLVSIAQRAVAALPSHVVDRVPERFVEDLR